MREIRPIKQHSKILLDKALAAVPRTRQKLGIALMVLSLIAAGAVTIYRTAITFAAEEQQAVWTGAVSTDWDNPLNWDGEVRPDNTTAVTIPDAATTPRDPQLSSTSPTWTVTISAGGLLNLNGYNLEIFGDNGFSNEGTLQLQGNEDLGTVFNDVDSGTVHYTGLGTYTGGLAMGSEYFNVIFGGEGSWEMANSLMVRGDFTLNSTLVTNDHSINVAGNWTNDGTYVGGMSEVTLDGEVGQLVLGSTTFYNLTKTGGSALTPLTFEAGRVQTVTNQLSLGGGAGSIMPLLSTNNGVHWTLDAPSSTFVNFVSVRDSNNTGVGPINPADSVDAGNNVNWFGPIPDEPSNLMPTEYVDGSYILDREPTFYFDVEYAANPSQQLQYRIQISTVANFSTQVVSYTSAALPQGGQSFYVGQPLDGGTYTQGGVGEPLPDGNYYLRVGVVDPYGRGVTYYVANGGAVAFGIDGTAPTTPGTPTTTTPSATRQPTWTWAASTDAVSGLAASAYTVSWSQSSTFSSGVSSMTATTNSYSHNVNLADGTWYFRVQARDNAGNNSAYSSNGSVVIDATAPTTPGTPTATTPGNDTTPTWTWTASTDVGVGLKNPAYTVSWSQSSSFATTTGSATVNTNTYTHATALAQGTWYFRVQASDTLDNLSSYSATGSRLIDTTNPTTPGAPSTTTPTNNTTPTWTWTASTDASSGLASPAYSVQWASDSGFTTNLGSSTSATNSFTHTALAQGTWYFRVRSADNAGNNSAYSTVRTVVIDTTAPTAPGTPSTSSPTTDTTPTWTWTASTDASSGLANPAYSVQWASDIAFTSNVGTATSNINSYTHGVALGQGLWYFRVLATDLAANATSYSAYGTVLVDTAAPSIPGQPSTATPTNDTTPTWSWTASTDGGSGLANPAYSVQWASDSGFTADLGSATTNSTSYTHGVALAQGTWYFRILATDTAGNTSAYSTYGTVLIDTAGPTTPGTPSTSTPTNDSTPTWTWTASTDTGSGLANPAYTIEWATNTGFTTNLGSATSNTNAFTHSVDLGQGTWYFRVRAIDLTGNNSSYSATGSVFIDTIAPTNPGTPTTTSPTADRTPTWTWTASTDGGSGLVNPAYAIQWASDSGFTTNLGSATSNTASFIHSADLADGTWYLRVRSSDITGNQSSWVVGAVVIDNTAANITDVTAASNTTTSQAISWTTDREASSQVEYGLTASYGSQTAESNTSPRVTSHAVQVSGLVACTTYHYRVISVDALSTVARSSDASFTTAGCASDAPVVAQDAVAAPAEEGVTHTLTNDGSTITVAAPANFTSSDVVLQVKQLGAQSALADIGLPTGFSAAATYLYDLKMLEDAGTAISSFDEPISITLNYTDADVDGLNLASLVIYRWDSGTGWQPLDDCVVDAAAKTVTCTTTHFSTFGIFGTVPVIEPEEPETPGGGSSSEGTGSGGAGSGSGIVAQNPGTGTPAPVDTDDDTTEPVVNPETETPTDNEGAPVKESDKPASDENNTAIWWWIIPGGALLLLVIILLATRRKRSD